MKMKSMVAAMTAVALSAFSFAAMTASAAVTEIPYTGPSEGALAVMDDWESIRLNLYNDWGNNVKDIEKMTPVVDNITITFTISGLGDKTTNEDGTAFQAFVCGSVSASKSFNPGEVGNDPVAINGDGQYTIIWDLPEDAQQIDCLLIGTNIKYTQYGASLEESGLNIKLDSIKTGVDDAPTEAPTDAPTEAPATEAPAATTTAAATTTGAAATTAAGTTTTKANTTTGNAATGDATPIAVALAGLTVAGAVALVSRKRK